MSKPRILHPGWGCCEAPVEKLRLHVDIAHQRIALNAELCRNLREAGDIAKAESIAYAGRAYRRWERTGVSERSWDNLGMRLLAHSTRLYGLANVYAMNCQFQQANLDRLIKAHQHRLDGEQS
jgi:hypothetical protein